METVIMYVQYIFLGLVQGFTEPLPISSSGHLVIVQHVFGVHVPDLHFEVFLNAASLIAVFVVYRHDLWQLTRGTLQYAAKPKTSDPAPMRYVLLLVIGTVPAVIAGLVLEGYIGAELTTLRTVGTALLITAIALWLIRNLRGKKTDDEITVIDTLIIGVAQMIALVPGISRSGATIAAALGRKLRPESALKFSFFLSIPVGIGSLVLMSPLLVQALTSPGLLVPYSLSFLAALVCSIVAIKLFIHVVTNRKLFYFALYCFTVAVLLWIFG